MTPCTIPFCFEGGFMKNNVKVISLAKFLNKYVSLCGEDLKKLTHEDVQILFPYFKRSSFDKIYNNQTLVSSGKVVLVNDGKKTIPYYAPQTLYLDDDYTEFFLDKIEEVPQLISYDYTEMSNYELKKILKEKFSTYKEKKNARRELEDRGVVMRKEMKRKREKEKEKYYGEY